MKCRQVLSKRVRGLKLCVTNQNGRHFQFNKVVLQNSLIKYRVVFYSKRGHSIWDRIGILDELISISLKFSDIFGILVSLFLLYP